jgi:hypothetical protein
VTEDHDFKNVVRSRMAKTGESYTAARAQLRDRPHADADTPDTHETPAARFDPSAFARDGYVVVRGLAGGTLVRTAAEVIKQELAARPPREGPNSRALAGNEHGALFTAFRQSPMWSVVTELLAPAPVEIVDDSAQLIVHPAPSDAINLTPHIDGHGPNFGTPSTFTLLLGVLMSDQDGADAGNVVVWPGTHLLYSEYLQAYGPTSLLEHAGRIRRAAPNVALPRPVPVRGKTGDVFFAHPLLGHETGANFNSRARKAIYLRLRRADHGHRWEQCLLDPLLEYNLGE